MAQDPEATVAEEDLPDTVETVEATPFSDEIVNVRITKAGDGKVHTGKHDASGPLFYKPGDIVPLARSIGEALEERHYGEIQ